MNTKCDILIENKRKFFKLNKRVLARSQSLDVVKGPGLIE